MEMILESVFLYLEIFIQEQDRTCLGLRCVGKPTPHSPCVLICLDHIMTWVSPYYIFRTLLAHQHPSTLSQ